MKVYVCSTGFYSDQAVRAVFSSKEAADQFGKLYEHANGEGGYKGSATRHTPRTAATIRSPKRGETFDGDLPSVGDALIDTVVGDDVDLSANVEEA